MSTLDIGFVGIAILFIMLFSGLPIWIGFAIVGCVGYALVVNVESAFSLLRTVVFSTFTSYNFSVLPLFLLMGSLAFTCRLSEDLYSGAHGVLGQLKGGLAMATIGGCATFAAISGSSIATAVTMGKVAFPEMKRYKYDDALSTGSIAAGGTIGSLIPPSTLFIIYGIITEQSIGKLYLSGVLPGILKAILFIAVIAILCWRNPNMGPPGPKTNFREKILSFSKSWTALVLFLLVMGGIYLGWFSANEAAGIGAFGVFVIGLFLRRLTWKGLLESLLDTAKSTSMILIIVAGATIFGYFITIAGVSKFIVATMAGLMVDKWVIFSVIIVTYLVLGCIMDGMAMVLITVPIFYPLMMNLGFDPIWFGVIVVMMVEIGAITPPVGMVVFVIHGMLKEVPMYTIFRGIIPFLIMDLVLIILVSVYPQIAMVLPNTMMKFK